jgi:hypothetical protein
MKIFVFVLAALLLIPCCKRREAAFTANPAAPGGNAERKPDEENVEPSWPAKRYDHTFTAEGREFRTFLSPKYGAWDIWLEYTGEDGKPVEIFTGCALQWGAMSDAYSAAYADGKIVLSYKRATSHGQDAVETRFVKTLADIERDGDSDGLSDVTEYRFMTDATNPDTDGDGLKDGEDINPLASSKAKFTPEQEIWKTGYLQYRDKLQYVLPDEILLAVFDKEWEFFELPDREEPVLAMTNEQVDDFRKDFGFGTRCVYFKKVTHLGTVDGKRRVSFELQEFYMSLQAVGYKLTLEEEDGKWKLVDSAIEWQS